MLRAFRDGVPIGSIVPASSPKPHAPPFTLARAIEVNADVQGEWAHAPAHYELGDGREHRLEVTPRGEAMAVYGREGARAMFVVLYDGRSRFDWPGPRR